MVLIVIEDQNIDWKNSEGGIGMKIDIIVRISHDENRHYLEPCFLSLKKHSLKISKVALFKLLNIIQLK